MVPALIDHPVALKDDATLELAQRIVFREFVVLLHADAKQPSKVHLLVLCDGFPCNVCPLAYNRLVPNLLVA